MAGFILLQLPRGRWIADLPRAFFNPPLSVAALTDDFASVPTLLTINVAAVVAALCMLLGYRTRGASVATTMLFIGAQSLTFATGKIDHNVLPALAPAVMAWSGWGDAWSLDAALGRIRHLEPERARPYWQLAWMALIIAIAMATAGIVKVRTGWLGLDVSSSYGHTVANAVLNGRQTWLGGVLLGMPSSHVWEVLDWATVLVETAGLIAVWRACWFRSWCFALAVFHLGVALQMDIWFAYNIAAYSLFVPWTAVVAPIRRRLPAVGSMRPAVIGAVVLVLTARAVVTWTAEATTLVTLLSRSVQRAIVLGAVPVAVWAWVANGRARRADAPVASGSPDRSERGASAGTGAIVRR